MNRHERRKRDAFRRKAIDASHDPAMRADYERGAEKHWQMFRHLLARLPIEDPPRFGLLTSDIALIAPIDLPPLRSRLARNYTAEIMISALITFAEVEGIEPPTYMMLRTFVEQSGLATDALTLDELGLRVSTVGEA